MKKVFLKSACIFMTSMSLVSCIENDIPYPYQAGDILSMEVEGQRGDLDGMNSSAVINKENRTVSLFVNDSVQLENLKITRLSISPEASLVLNAENCVDYDNFPKKGFASLDSLSRTSNTRMDFSKPVKMTLQTYQEYEWTVSVTQLIERVIDIENMVRYVIDADSRKAVIYVSSSQPLTNLKVNKMDLGGVYGKIWPDPLAITDYSKQQTFVVYQHGNEENGAKWDVFVFHTEEENTVSAGAFPMTTKAYITGTATSSSSKPVVEYKKNTDASWSALSSSAVIMTNRNFSAELSGLSAATTYQYRVTDGDQISAEQTFTTTRAIPLTDASFDNWSQDASNSALWYPWASGATPFWDTGNKGATTIGSSNTVSTTETCNGSGLAAKLESKYILIKFAAGSIFTGSYVRTDGTNGVLSFGQEFSAFPSKLRINYKYTSAEIDRIGDSDLLSHLKGKPDTCNIYIALTDWDEPFTIKTRPSERSLFDKNDSHVIGYAEFTSATSTSSYQQLDLPIVYRYTNRTPKYILVVATSSKYGDYFTGGTGSTLLVDNFALIYD